MPEAEPPQNLENLGTPLLACSRDHSAKTGSLRRVRIFTASLCCLEPAAGQDDRHRCSAAVFGIRAPPAGRRPGCCRAEPQRQHTAQIDMAHATRPAGQVHGD